MVLELHEVLRDSHMQNFKTCETSVISFEFKLPRILRMTKISFFGGSCERDKPNVSYSTKT